MILSEIDPSNRLQRVIALRWFGIAAELGLVLLMRKWLGGGAALGPVLGILAAQAALNIHAAVPGRRTHPVSDRMLFAQLLFDVGALTGIAYLAGGSRNPLISLYLPWIAVGSAMLETRQAAALVAASIACYTFVNFVHADIHVHNPAKAFQIHMAGMLLTFVFSAAMIGWFVARLTAAVRQRDAQLAAAREAALRSERVLALGNLAAGAAHELGTPLATMAVLAGEMLQEPDLPAPLHADLDLMRTQIAECKRIITELATQAGTSRAESAQPIALDAWLAELLGRWRRQRPQIEPRVTLAGTRPGPRIAAETTLGQALLNLFNNAADASPDAVEIAADWDAEALDLRVADRGAGIAPEIEGLLGREPVSTRGAGLGMGVLLAYAAIERAGGTLAFSERADGGTLASVRLPLRSLGADALTPAPAAAHERRFLERTT